MTEKPQGTRKRPRHSDAPALQPAPVLPSATPATLAPLQPQPSWLTTAPDTPLEELEDAWSTSSANLRASLLNFSRFVQPHQQAFPTDLSVPAPLLGNPTPHQAFNTLGPSNQSIRAFADYLSRLEQAVHDRRTATAEHTTNPISNPGLAPFLVSVPDPAPKLDAVRPYANPIGQVLGESWQPEGLHELVARELLYRKALNR